VPRHIRDGEHDAIDDPVGQNGPRAVPRRWLFTGILLLVLVAGAAFWWWLGRQ
jgi:hypothetical protein